MKRDYNKDGGYMKRVDLSEFSEPCVYYAAKRIGVSIKSLKNRKKFKKHIFDLSKIKKGDVLVWKKGKKLIPCSDLIEGTSVITRRIDASCHYGVYEGGGMVSHFTDDLQSIPLNIRIIKLNCKENGRMPDFFLRKRA